MKGDWLWLVSVVLTLALRLFFLGWLIYAAVHQKPYYMALAATALVLYGLQDITDAVKKNGMP